MTIWDLPLDARLAGLAVVGFLKSKGLIPEPRTKIFYTPEEWKEREEQYGLKGLLIITHDGGNHAPAFNWDYGDQKLIEELRVYLEIFGFYVEQCTSWYSAIYKI